MASCLLQSVKKQAVSPEQGLTYLQALVIALWCFINSFWQTQNKLHTSPKEAFAGFGSESVGKIQKFKSAVHL